MGASWDQEIDKKGTHLILDQPDMSSGAHKKTIDEEIRSKYEELCVCSGLISPHELMKGKPPKTEALRKHLESARFHLLKARASAVVDEFLFEAEVVTDKKDIDRATFFLFEEFAVCTCGCCIAPFGASFAPCSSPTRPCSPLLFLR